LNLDVVSLGNDSEVFVALVASDATEAAIGLPDNAIAPVRVGLLIAGLHNAEQTKLSWNERRRSD
jgi:hypothetical protein